LAAPDLAHRLRIAEDVDRGLQSLVFGDVDQDCLGAALSGDDDLFLPLLHAVEKLRKMRFTSEMGRVRAMTASC
jgi:hypothetical protein